MKVKVPKKLYVYLEDTDTITECKFIKNKKYIIDGDTFYFSCYASPSCTFQACIEDPNFDCLLDEDDDVIYGSYDSIKKHRDKIVTEKYNMWLDRFTNGPKFER